MAVFGVRSLSRENTISGASDHIKALGVAYFFPLDV